MHTHLSFLNPLIHSRGHITYPILSLSNVQQRLLEVKFPYRGNFNMLSELEFIFF